MAGELLVKIIDLDRFETIRPALDEIDAGLALSPAARAVVAEVAGGPAADKMRRGRRLETLERILRRPELAPRLFLSPGEIDDVVEIVLYATSVEGGDAWSLTEVVGDSWVVVERASLALQDSPALADAFFFGASAEGRDLPHPKRGERRLAYVHRAALPALAAELATLLAAPDLEGRNEVEGLARLIRRAETQPGATLVYQFLL